jgi:MFS transporter, DHA3 family, macrolide efflux protein
LANNLNRQSPALLPPGVATFLILWVGQAFSSIGSRLSEFALGVWVYQQTHSTTQFSLVYLSIFLPEMIVAPVSGGFIDCGDRRQVMIVSTFGAGLSTLAIAVLCGLGKLEVWGICGILIFRSIFTTFSLRSYATLPSLLVPPQYLSRASGMVQLSRATAEIMAPMLSGALLMAIQIQGIIWVDTASFMIAIVTLLIVQLPRFQDNPVIAKSRDSIWQDIQTGWQHIVHHRELFRLMLFFLLPQFTLGILWVLFPPLVLSFASSLQLGMVMSIGGLGWLLGSLYMSVCGGPKSKLLGVWIGVLGQGLFLLLGGLQPSVNLAAIGILGYLFAYPIAMSCYQTLWQSAIHPELQGRVFGVRYLLEQLPLAIALMVAGPLADQLFEPAMARNGWLAGSIGALIGVGTGRGIGLAFLLLGIGNGVVALIMSRSATSQPVEL